MSASSWSTVLALEYRTYSAEYVASYACGSNTCACNYGSVPTPRFDIGGNTREIRYTDTDGGFLSAAALTALGGQTTSSCAVTAVYSGNDVDSGPGFLVTYSDGSTRSLWPQFDHGPTVCVANALSVDGTRLITALEGGRFL